LSGSDDNSTEATLLDRVRRAIEHAEGAVRCYLALAAAEGRRLVRSLMQEAVWMAGLVGFGLIGLVLLVFGVATFVQSRLEMPGGGLMIVGGAMIALFAAAMVALKTREGK